LNIHRDKKCLEEKFQRKIRTAFYGPYSIFVTAMNIPVERRGSTELLGISTIPHFFTNDFTHISYKNEVSRSNCTVLNGGWLVN